MKYYSTTSTFQFPWDQVITAFWSRYPNPYSNHVKTEDTLERKVISDKLYTKRLVSKTKSVPRWGQAFVPRTTEYIIEESVLDLKTRELTTYSRNIGMTKIAVIEEKCIYRPVKCEEVASTSGVMAGVQAECERHVWVTSHFARVGRAIQSFLMTSFKRSLSGTMNSWNWTLNRMFHNATLQDHDIHKNLGTSSISDKLPTHALHMKTDRIRDTATERLQETASKAKGMAKFVITDAS